MSVRKIDRDQGSVCMCVTMIKKKKRETNSYDV